MCVIIDTCTTSTVQMWSFLFLDPPDESDIVKENGNYQKVGIYYPTSALFIQVAVS